RESFGLISEALLHQYDSELNEIFETVSYEKEGQRFFNELYDLHTIQSKIRLAFSIKRDLQTDTEIIPKQAELLIAERLTDVERNPRLYPNEADTTKILELDKSNAEVNIDTAEIEKAYQLVKNTLEQQGLGNMVPSFESFKADKDYSLPVKSKNQTFRSEERREGIE